jgi:hypothetical protein
MKPAEASITTTVASLPANCLPSSGEEDKVFASLQLPTTARVRQNAFINRTFHQTAFVDSAPAA